MVIGRKLTYFRYQSIKNGMKILRNIIGFVFGAYVGGKVNMDFIMASNKVVPLPEGVNLGDMESLVANIHLFEPINYLMPFFAHSIGTLVGAFIAVFIVATHKMYFGLGIGVIFLIGGIAMIFMLPSPMWFNVLDIGVAYIPMGWLGWKLADKMTGSTEA